MPSTNNGYNCYLQSNSKIETNSNIENTSEKYKKLLGESWRYGDYVNKSEEKIQELITLTEGLLNYEEAFRLVINADNLNYINTNPNQFKAIIKSLNNKNEKERSKILESLEISLKNLLA